LKGLECLEISGKITQNFQKIGITTLFFTGLMPAIPGVAQTLSKQVRFLLADAFYSVLYYAY